jgi:hypothetical protein
MTMILFVLGWTGLCKRKATSERRTYCRVQSAEVLEPKIQSALERRELKVLDTLYDGFLDQSIHTLSEGHEFVIGHQLSVPFGNDCINVGALDRT